jgi:hypothetical protein
MSEQQNDAVWKLALAIQWANQFWIGNTLFTKYVEEAFLLLMKDQP